MGQAGLLIGVFLLGWSAPEILLWVVSRMPTRAQQSVAATGGGTPGPKVYRKGGKRKPVANDDAAAAEAEIKAIEREARL